MLVDSISPTERFPPMRQQPSFAEIMACLDELRASKSAAGDGEEGAVWDCAVPRDEIEACQALSALEVQRYTSAIARYLSSIVMSDLAWLPDEDDREALWTAASRRIAERCGRTAIGDITRRWPLPLEDGRTTATAVDLIIKEPALVGDDCIGFKTWGTAYAMARLLPALAASPAMRGLQPMLLHDDLDLGPSSAGGGGLPVLELGAGTGLLGLAAAALWRADVVLSDLAAIVPNLAANVERNAAAIAQACGGRPGCGRVRAGVLQWGASRDDGPEAVDPLLFPRDHQFPLVLAADPVYDEEHPALLARAIDAQLLVAGDGSGPKLEAGIVSEDARAIVMVPLRDRQTEKMAAQLVAEMAKCGLVPIHAGEIAGQDSDWGSGGGDGGAGPGCEFMCSWWVFRRHVMTNGV